MSIRLEHVGLLYRRFKKEQVVETLIDLASRYARTFYVVSAAKKAAVLHWFEQWQERLLQLRSFLPLLVEHDHVWLRAEQYLRANGLVEPTSDSSEEVIQQIFQAQIDFCFAYFQMCWSVCMRRWPVEHGRKVVHDLERNAHALWRTGMSEETQVSDD